MKWGILNISLISFIEDKKLAQPWTLGEHSDCHKSLKERREILETLFDHTNLFYLTESSKVVMQP